MAAIAGLTKLRGGAGPEVPAQASTIGPALGAAGLMLAMITVIANWSSISDVGNDAASVAERSQWAGAVGVASLGTIKVAIALVLVGIIGQLWNRVASLTSVAPALSVRDGADQLDPATNPLKVTDEIPPAMRIHRVAGLMWRPALAMGIMGVVLGTILRIVASSEGAGTESFRELAAWGSGVLFLGEALLLSGISFLLATILASLRQGGGEVQSAAGTKIKTLLMPPMAKAFLALMMVGLMVGIGQLVASIVLAGRADDPASYAELAAFVGPLREFALGVILAGVVLALATIGTVLAFQFERIREIARMH